MSIPPDRGRVSAILGPTNTGKTTLAVERMLGYRSGMIGCPLRLLAREIYDRVVERRGAAQIALITGEERIVPPRARYFICTVESMPLDRSVDFLAVDEIQLAADPERGHVFTDRLLHARGLCETMFLGAATIEPLIAKLLPEAERGTRPRFSKLSYAGQKRIGRLPRRSAIVAFSAAEVYGIAEMIRRLRGGTAVVLGALSPRTRNAQVALYQAGEVDYMVATDAIGMGLNMDVDHVAFTALRKFDGRVARDLSPAEIAQIAGRAGRYMRDGTFGVTAGAPALDPEMVEAVENHDFAPLKRLYWRNPRQDMTSLSALIRSLDVEPPRRELARPRDAEDLLSLKALATDAEIAKIARGRDALMLLWDVCRIPDYRKIMADTHVSLLGQIYRQLAGPRGVLLDPWVDRQIARLDQVQGDLDTLAARVAHIRTWNYIAHRPDWVRRPDALQERTRAIEDRLSDALHERLTQRFVDRRASVLTRELARGGDLIAAMRADGSVVVEGEPVGRLEGLRFLPDDEDAWTDGRALRAVVRRALGGWMDARVAEIMRSADTAFSIGEGHAVLWQGAPVARLTPGRDLLAVEIKVETPEGLDARARRRLHGRLARWLDGHTTRSLGPLLRLREAPLRGAARGLAFQMVEHLGTVPTRLVKAQVDSLEAGDRKALTRLGVRLGRETVFMPAMLKPRAIGVRALLWSLSTGETGTVPNGARHAVPTAPGTRVTFYEALGFRVLGPWALRVDMLERLGAALRKRRRTGPFAIDDEIVSLAGCGKQDLPALLQALGYGPVATPDVQTGGEIASGPQKTLYAPVRHGPHRHSTKNAPRTPRHPAAAIVAASGSPFAILARLRRR